MTRFQPTDDPISQLFRQLSHFSGFVIGNHAGPLVCPPIAFLTKTIQEIDQFGFGADREEKRLDDAEMMGVTTGAIPGRRQSGGGDL
jgi:hypothetical protein